MPRIPSITEAEWDVMNAVWEAGDITAAEITARLAASREWSPQTVKTLLNRLVAKKALAFVAEGNRYRYRAKVRREDCLRAESTSFLARVFGGAASPLIAHLVEHSELTPDEIARLRRLLDAKER